MIIQFILVSILTITLIFAFVRRRRMPVIGWSVLLLSGSGIMLVIFPDATQRLAHAVGVGRGADLVTYIFISIMLVVILDVYLKLRSFLNMLTITVRHIGLIEAEKEKASGEK